MSRTSPPALTPTERTALVTDATDLEAQSRPQQNNGWQLLRSSVDNGIPYSRSVISHPATTLALSILTGVMLSGTAPGTIPDPKLSGAPIILTVIGFSLTILSVCYAPAHNTEQNPSSAIASRMAIASVAFLVGIGIAKLNTLIAPWFNGVIADINHDPFPATRP